MTEGSTPPASGTIAFLNMEAEDQRRQTIERRRARLRQRLDQAFAPFPRDSSEWDTARAVRDFLGFVADNIDSYRTRARVLNPHTGAFQEEEWVRICGATIGALEAPERIRQLILELVAELIPDQDPDHRLWLAEAAGMHLRARASADDVKALQKKGIMAAFAGKLLVDTKSLISGHSLEEVNAYFDAARKVAQDIEDSPYQTDLDHRFIRLLRKSYDGDLLALVEAQRARATAEIREKSLSLPRLEQTLRDMLETQFQHVSSRSIEDWLIAARIAYQNEAYVYSRLDEFRSKLNRRLDELEAEPLLNPEAMLEEVVPKLSTHVLPLVETLRQSSAGWSFSESEQIDVFQLVRANAALLGKSDMVDPFNAFIGDRNLLELYARYKRASFKRDEPDMRKKLHSDLIMWDEIFRSAPLSADQEARLSQLRESLLEPLESAGRELPPDIRQAKMLLPFGGGILTILKTSDEFEAFERWLQKVQRVYNDRLSSAEDLDAVEPEELLPPPPATRKPLARTKEWAPTLVDLSAAKKDAGAAALPVQEGTPLEQSPRRTSASWLKKWLRGD